MAAKSYQILAQAAPAASGSATELFTTLTPCIIAFLNICNIHATNVDDYDVAVVPPGDTLGAKHWLRKGYPLENRDDDRMLEGLGVATGTKFYIRSTNGTSSFTLTGVTNP